MTSRIAPQNLAFFPSNGVGVHSIARYLGDPSPVSQAMLLILVPFWR